jgi:hypothetical protein
MAHRRRPLKAAPPIADNTAVTSLVFDASGAKKGAADFPAAGTLDWEELPGGQDSRISVALDDADPENEADWMRQHEWLARRLNEMHRVLAPRVGLLDPDSWRPQSV